MSDPLSGTPYFNVRGLKELEQALDELPANMEKNIARGAVRAGGVVFRDEARRLVPVESGALRDSIRVVARRSRGGRVLVNVVAGRSGKDQPWYARFVEFGTAPHRIDPLGKGALLIGSVFAEKAYHPGAAAKPFMRPAFDTKARQAVEAVADYIRRRLDKLKGQ